jgi:hypothetical protein
MAKKPATKKPRAAKQKPFPKYTKPALRERKAVVDDIRAICVKVEDVMAARKSDVSWTSRYGNGPLMGLRLSTDKLVDEFKSIMRAKPQAGEEISDYEDEGSLFEILNNAIRAPAGEPPTWTQAGEFLIWAGRVPILCRWGGWVFPNGRIVAVDPNLPWLTENGEQDVGVASLPQRATSPVALFRLAIAAYVQHKEFRLLTLGVAPKAVRGQRSPYRSGVSGALDLVAATVEAEGEWLQAALARGPVDAIPLPANTPSIQQSFI